ncbi:MAG: AMP-binding protein [Fimbriimonadaceae bacterium]|nr:AMP-binding protein [Fimbriimonadaceae bacterium]
MGLSLGLADLVADGVPEAVARQVLAVWAAVPAGLGPPERWQWLQRELPGRPPLAVWRRLFAAVYADWDQAQGPPPAWLPTADDIALSNLGQFGAARGFADYRALHAWSVTDRAGFWDATLRRLGIRFATPPTTVLADLAAAEHPDWLPGARLNIAASCFQAPADRVAVRCQTPGRPLRETTYRELQTLSQRVAAGLLAADLQPGEAVAVVLPMGLAAVAAYLGVILAGGVVVSIADSFAAPEIAARLRLGAARRAITSGSLAPKLRAADAGPLVVVEPADLGAGETAWDDFLAAAEGGPPVPRAPSDACNILFSSGTTAEPKAIPWTHLTPLRAAADGHWHHDLQPGDVVAWPTSLGWMMGPWLVFATLLNGATMAIYEGSPLGRGFGEFVQEAGVTMLGVVPSLVKAWRQTGCMEPLDWSRVRRFSSTGECSNADDYFYLMWLAGWKPVIEYCGGTEIGGGYLTGTMVQPAAPGTFSTPALGLDFVILDETGRSSSQGELLLRPPSIGLSDRLLNQDHHAVYHEGLPAGPHGELLRRHGDQMEALGGGYYRSHGRADDAMNLKGIKVSSAEIERALQGVAGVLETAAVAVNGPDGGPSQLVVFVVLAPGTASSGLRGTLQKALRRHYGSLYSIGDVQVVDRLPRTASNKVQRRLLRDSYQQGASHGPT